MPPLDETARAFVTASRALVGITVRSVAAAPVEVTVAQHRLLVLVADGERSVGEIADELGVNQSNASRQCDRLERLGLVERRRSAGDGRVVQVRLTADGHAVIDAVTAHRRGAVRRVLERMAADDVAAALAGLRAFNEAASEVEPAPGRR